ncbi:MAG: hypothetical protein KBD53_05740 [Candidatus Omnitrophica bacterium]|nr:hypothetical protein [Candidatus Omnitrophota bacterium]
MKIRLKNKFGLTLIEILLAVSLTTLMGLSVYHSLTTGINVWKRSQQLNLEEDVLVFLEKLSADLYNSFLFVQIKFEGNEFRIAFPTMVYTAADKGLQLEDGAYIEQIGKVEYYYDVSENKIFRREANFSQALDERYGEPRLLASSVTNVKFRYFFMTDSGELSSAEILDVLPTGVEIEVEFSDKNGKRSMKKFIEIPVGS